MNKTTVTRFNSTTTALTTMTPNFYLPDPAWALIFEFHNAAPLRREKRAIAEACAECVSNESRRRTKFLERRYCYCDPRGRYNRFISRPESRSYWNARFATAPWEKVRQPHWHPDRRVPALIDLLKGIRRLKVPELKRRLKANGVRGYSKMRKQELIMACVKL